MDCLVGYCGKLCDRIALVRSLVAPDDVALLASLVLVDDHGADEAVEAAALRLLARLAA